MKEKKSLCAGFSLLGCFVLWTALVQTVNVRPIGPEGSTVGFASLNGWFHHFTGVHMGLYIVTDWLGLVPVFCCMSFSAMGFLQLLKRRSLLRVDADILLLGGHYLLVILAYLLFELYPINYRPVLISGILEASYPSSTTLLVACVMPTVSFQARRRIKAATFRSVIPVCSDVFSLLMIVGRTAAGVHWLTDIIGALLLSAGLCLIYRSVVMLLEGKTNQRRSQHGAP